MVLVLRLFLARIDSNVLFTNLAGNSPCLKFQQALLNL